MSSERFFPANSLVQTALIGCLAFLPLSAAAQLQIVETPQDALKKAQSLLKLVDAGKYDEAFRNLGPDTQKKTSADALTKRLTERRVPLGALRSRKLMCATMYASESEKNLYIDFATSFAAVAPGGRGGRQLRFQRRRPVDPEGFHRRQSADQQDDRDGNRAELRRTEKKAEMTPAGFVMRTPAA